MARGGFRPGAGRKKLPIEQKKIPRKFYLNAEQYKIVKTFVEKLKKGVLECTSEETSQETQH